MLSLLGKELVCGGLPHTGQLVKGEWLRAVSKVPPCKQCLMQLSARASRPHLLVRASHSQAVASGLDPIYSASLVLLVLLVVVVVMSACAKATT